MIAPSVGPVVAIAALLLLPAAVAAPARVPASGAPEGLVVTATPTNGTAPLKVQFGLAEAGGSPTSVAWAFGDGTYLNGSAAADDAPSHVYEWPGSYTCRVTAFWPSGSENATVTVRVASANFTVAAVANPTAGNAPLTVAFTGTVTGGSGTFVGYLWQFGNGATGSGLAVRYTYPSPGTYTAIFSATDSLNRTATASVVVRVGNASGNPPPGSGGNGTVPDLTIPIAAGLSAVGIVAVVVGVLWVRRSRQEDGPSGPDPTAPERVGALALPPAAREPGASGAPNEAEPVEPASGTPERASDDAPGERPATLTYQILAHLAGLPRLSEGGEAAPPGFTQAGIATALGVGQSAVSRVLRRLVAAGALRVETRHVAGAVRRLRVYTLTDRGERLGRALRDAPGIGGTGGPGGSPPR